ncbi:MAG: MerR family transcriptional regulator [Bacillota bacterium]|nr:MerR family transcriptional regulator [Bacillota bacterium]
MRQDSGNRLLRIGELSERTGVSVRTIRYYEERGLLEPAGRTEAGYRLYDERALGALKVLRRLRMLGLGLDEIAALKHAYSQEGRCGALLLTDYARALDDRIREVDRHLSELRLLRDDLVRHRDRLVALHRSGDVSRVNEECRSLLGGGPETGGTWGRGPTPE